MRHQALSVKPIRFKVLMDVISRYISSIGFVTKIIKCGNILEEY